MTYSTFKNRLKDLENKKAILETETFALLRQYEYELTLRHTKEALCQVQ